MASSTHAMSRCFAQAASAVRAVSSNRPVQRALVQRSLQSSRRGYSSSTSYSSTSSTRLIVGAAGLLAASGGVFCYYRNNKQSFPAEKAPAVFNPTKEDYQKVYNEIARLLVEKDDYDDGSYGPVLVRLAWHCSGTYDASTGTGGSNGATMRFAPESDHGANAGLKHARDFLEPVKEKFRWISYSDLWTLAGATAIQEMQGPLIPWRPGRQDRDISFCTPDGRLPDGAKEQNHLHTIFGRMGFNDREIVALSGAHALGRCHPDRSGFEGPWDFSPTVMTNEFFRLLVDEKWNWRKWNGPKQYTDQSTGTLMMLPTDMALVKDAEFKKHVVRYARDSQAFFEEFSDVFCKLLELGVPFKTEPKDRFTFKTTEETEE